MLKKKVQINFTIRRILCFKMKAILSLCIIMMLMIVVSANLGTFKQNECVNIRTILNTTSVNISTITPPNSVMVILNEVMTKNGLTFNYTYCNTSQLGTYVYDYFDDEGNTYVNDFDINYIGIELTIQQSIINIALLSFLILLFILIFAGMNYLPKSNEQDEYGRIMSISILKYLRLPLWLTAYFLLIGLVFISSNISLAYLNNEMLGKLLFAIFTVLMVLSPVVIIIIVISFFVKFFHDKEFQRMLNRGMFPGGQL